MLKKIIKQEVNAQWCARDDYSFPKLLHFIPCWSRNTGCNELIMNLTFEQSDNTPRQYELIINNFKQSYRCS